MSDTNYLRVLRNVRCTECQHEGYDTDFENWEFTTVEETENTLSQTVDIKNICPECGAINKIEYYNEYE